MSLAGKVFVIFGGSSGMGKGAAKAIVGRGGTAWIVGRDATKLKTAAAEVSGGNGDDTPQVKTSSLDVLDAAAVGDFFASLPNGSIHGIVNTIGPSAGASSVLGQSGLDGLRRQFDMKFFAQVATISLGAEKIADGGSIVLCSGALSRRPGAGSAALAAANAACEAIVKALANDLGPRLRVNCVSPGLTNTEMWAGMPIERREGMLKGFGSSLPLGRAGESDDVGHAVAFLLENTYVTGTTLDVDGGAVIRK
jgi:NAD(P)-dependent dehydrogenase (short-subunit alcohol dehydrogenase family)